MTGESSQAVAAPVVVKIGGSLVTAGLAAFWEGVRTLRQQQPVIVVHGGGPEATRVARMLGHEPQIVQGRRVTSQMDLQIMEWVARGALNTRLVGQALASGVRAVGLSGVDDGLILVDRRPPWTVDGQKVDFGFVGDVRAVNARVLNALMSSGLIPVIAPLGVDRNGQAYNVNADTIAREIAAAVRATCLLLVTEGGCVRNGVEGSGSIVTRCDRRQYQTGVSEGWITGGMRVKLQVAFEALDAGVDDVFIVGPEDVVSRTQGTRVVL